MQFIVPVSNCEFLSPKNILCTFFTLLILFVCSYFRVLSVDLISDNSYLPFFSRKFYIIATLSYAKINSIFYCNSVTFLALMTSFYYISIIVTLRAAIYCENYLQIFRCSFNLLLLTTDSIFLKIAKYFSTTPLSYLTFFSPR